MASTSASRTTSSSLVMNCVLILTSWLLLNISAITTSSVGDGRVGGMVVKCEVCDQSRCPELHYCKVQTVKDHCGCCDVCPTVSRLPPHHMIGDALIRSDSDDGDDVEGNACAKVKCPKFKVCVENVQHLPLCTCPNPLICKQRRSRQKPVCGSDGKTYSSRCYLRVAACNSANRIKVDHRGPCTGADGSSRGRGGGGGDCDSVKSCRRRKNQNPVCGTDGKTYPSRCHMKIVSCQRGIKIKTKHHGKCSSGSGSVSARRDHRVPGSVSEQDQNRESSGSNSNRLRKERRRRKKKGGSDGVLSPEVEGKRRLRKQRRRDQRKKKQQRRRKRRKTRGHSRQRRYKLQDRGQSHRNSG